MEKWKSIKGYEGYYEVSDKGRVRSLDREIVYNNGRVHYHKGSILKHLIDNEYHRVSLTREGKRKRFLVHRLVAEAFIPNTDKKEQVDHIDGNPNNNTLENLQWISEEENLAKRKGHSARKPVGQYDLQGNLIAIHSSIAEAGRKTGISENSIRTVIKNGKSNISNGFKWFLI